MRESTFWRTPRFLALIVVAALHVALIALLLMASGVMRAKDSAYQPIELIYIATPPPLPVRADTGRALRLYANIAPSPPSPVFDSAPPTATSTGSGSRGVGIDWLAEAHRAIKAYEIRRDNPSDNALSGKTPTYDWWPQQGPHAGDRYKTESGDWIVWIDADCYKVASARSNGASAAAAPPDIVCPKKRDAAPSSH